MQKMNFKDSVICLPGKVSEHIKSASAAELRVLLAIASGCSEEEVVDVSGCTEAEVQTAMAFWRGADILFGEENTVLAKKPSEQKSDSYTGADVERICAERPNIKNIIDMSMKILEKADMTWRERSVFVYLSDHLRLDDEYILLLVSHCMGLGKPSLTYIEKTAISLYTDGITTVSALESYIKTGDEKRKKEYAIREMFGIGERRLGRSEKEILDKWDKSGFSLDLITEALEANIKAIGKASLAYTNSILDNWAQEGITDAAVAREKSEKKKGQKKVKNEKPGFDIDEFFNLAVTHGDKRE